MRSLALLLIVLLALGAGALFGYRLRISQEVVIYHPDKMLPPIPDELAVEYDGDRWAYLWPVP